MAAYGGRMNNSLKEMTLIFPFFVLRVNGLLWCQWCHSVFFEHEFRSPFGILQVEGVIFSVTPLLAQRLTSGKHIASIPLVSWIFYDDLTSDCCSHSSQTRHRWHVTDQLFIDKDPIKQLLESIARGWSEEPSCRSNVYRTNLHAYLQIRCIPHSLREGAEMLNIPVKWFCRSLLS